MIETICLLGCRRQKKTNTEPDLSGTQLKRWVVHISSHTLSDNEKKLLAKGLYYAVTPTEVPKDDFIVATEVACRALPQSSACQLRAEVAGVP